MHSYVYVAHLVCTFHYFVAIKLVTNVEQMWAVECLMATNRSFVLKPYLTQLLRMKFFGYIIWNSLSFCILPTSTHIVTIFRFGYFISTIIQASSSLYHLIIIAKLSTWKGKVGRMRSRLNEEEIDFS